VNYRIPKILVNSSPIWLRRKRFPCRTGPFQIRHGNRLNDKKSTTIRTAKSTGNELDDTAPPGRLVAHTLAAKNLKTKRNHHEAERRQQQTMHQNQLGSSFSCILPTIPRTSVSSLSQHLGESHATCFTMSLPQSSPCESICTKKFSSPPH
jgi:hypothetical protein